jgi:ABC-2 type transport system permease protein
VSESFVEQVGQLARRSVVRTARQPANIVFPLVFPLLLLAVNSSGLQSATHLPGFPTDSYLAFALAVPFMQGALFATMNAGTDLARDIQTGFLNRLALTPMRGVALLAGQLGGVMAMTAVQAAVWIAAGLILGVHFVFSLLIGLGFGALGAFLALRTGSGEAVQGMFPVFFVFLFISSMAMPRNLIEIKWFQTAATLNPVSYLIEGIRSLIVIGWDPEALTLGFGIALLIASVAVSLATLSLRTRLTRS